GVQIGFGAIEPNGRGIVGVAREQEAIGAVKKTNRIGRVAGSGNNFERAVAEVEFVAVMDILGDGPGLGAIRFRIKALGKLATDLAWSELILSVSSGTLGILPAEIRVHAEDGVELPVAANVIVVGVRIQDDDRESRESRDQLADVADAHAGVKEQRFFLAKDEVGDDLFGLVRFVDGEGVWRDFVNLEPGIGGRYALKGFVFRARKTLTPFGNLCICVSSNQWCKRHRHKCGADK